MHRISLENSTQRGKVEHEKFPSHLYSRLPAFPAWLDVLDPISKVFAMGGVHNTLRRLVRDDTSVVTGLHGIGNSVCTTNPTLGRGLSLALSSAVSLRETIMHSVKTGPPRHSIGL